MMHTAENKTRIYIYRTPISLYSVHIQYTRCTLLADKNMNKLCKQFSFLLCALLHFLTVLSLALATFKLRSPTGNKSNCAFEESLDSPAVVMATQSCSVSEDGDSSLLKPEKARKEGVGTSM